MSEQPVFLDVNVPMYAAGRAHPYSEACAWVMAEIAEDRLDVAIDTEIIQEILYRFGSLHQWENAVRMASNLLALVSTVYPVLPADARLAVELFKRYAPEGIPARDLIHVAVMRTNGVSTIISVDTHFDRIEGMKRLDPRELFRISGVEV
jgi:predicted nucleic acid-binding protein